MRVVVPVDFSAESDRALVTAPVLAGWAGARVELLTVVEPSERPDVEPKLAETARRLGNGTTFRIVESGGPPQAVLLTELHAGRKEFWCVGSHARGAFSELFLESLSEDLVREAHMPLVLVGPHCTTAPTERFLAVALDDTDESEAILPAAADLAPALGMTLRLLQVADIGRSTPGGRHRDRVPRPRRREDQPDHAHEGRLRRPPRPRPSPHHRRLRRRTTMTWG